MLIVDIIEKHARKKCEKAFLKCEGREYTFSDTYRNVLKVADYLSNRRICEGDRVAIILPNSPEFAFFYYGCAAVGALSVPIDTRYRQKEIRAIIENCRPKIIITLSSYHGNDYKLLLKEVQDLDKNNVQLVFIDKLDIFNANNQGCNSKYQFVTKKNNLPMVIMYTSGSTGEPKGAVLSENNLVSNAEAVITRLAISENDIFLLMVPFSHAFGSSVLLNEALVAGATVIITDTFNPEAVLPLIQKEHVTLLYAVPTQIVQLIEAKRLSGFRIDTLRTGYISGASCNAEFVKMVKADLNCDVCIAYGMTEASCISITDLKDSSDIRENTVGKAVNGMEIKIVDDDGNETERGKPGEICIRGKSLMSCYYSSELLANEWFRTGDVGFSNSDGNLSILGRKKEMIIRGGFNIYPGEIEQHLLTNRKIKFAAVVGIPDKEFGEKTAACIVPYKNETISEADVKSYCKKDLASYKVPDYVQLYESMPMTASRKIKKNLLKIDVEKNLI